MKEPLILSRVPHRDPVVLGFRTKEFSHQVPTPGTLVRSLLGGYRLLVAGCSNPHLHNLVSSGARPKECCEASIASTRGVAKSWADLRLLRD